MRKGLTLVIASVIAATLWAAPSHAEDPPQPLMRDYEDYDVGEPERNAYIGNKDEGTILVTDEASKSGSQSLKFTDAPGLEFSWLPYVVYPLTQTEGSLKMAFDLRWDAGAMLAMEWRDAAQGYTIGPNLTTTANGRLYATGKKLAQLPEGKWVHIEMTCPLGDAANGKFDVSVTLPGTEAQVTKINLSSPKFKAVVNVVLMGMNVKSANFYIDNLAFVPVEN